MTEKHKKAPKILKYTWLAIAIISGLTSIHAFVNHGFTKDFLIFIIILGLALFMFRLRSK